MSDLASLKDHFLLSMPHLESDYFSASLIYLCEHNDDGAMGFVINKPTELNLGEVLAQLELDCSTYSLSHQPVYLGGPVSEDRGFLLHSPKAGTWTSTLEITDSLSLSTSMDLLSELAAGQGPEQFIFALGYSGWAPGQLEQEIGANLWLSCPASLDILFAPEPTQKLTLAASALGIDLNLLSTQAGHA